MSNTNFYSFVPAKINHTQYEKDIVSEGHFSGDAGVYEQIIEHIGLGEKRVLDLASGSGLFGKTAHKMGAKWKIDAVDFLIPDKTGNYECYENIFEEDILKNFDKYSGYDYVVSNHFFEHLYINQVIELLDKLKGVKLIIACPLPHLTLAYNRFYLKAVNNVETIEGYKYLIGAIHKTSFDDNLIKYLNMERLSTSQHSQILVKVKDLQDKNRYSAQVYITTLQYKTRYLLINYFFFICLYPFRFVRKVFRLIKS